MRTWGDDTLDYFALRRDKNYFFSADGRSLIAYIYVRGTAMAAGDPIGPKEDTARTVDESCTSAPDGAGGRRSSPCAKRTARSTEARGMHVIYLGDEAIVVLPRVQRWRIPR